MATLMLTTFSRVPKLPRGYVRDLRVRWALKEAARRHRVQSVPFRARAGVDPANGASLIYALGRFAAQARTAARSAKVSP